MKRCARTPIAPFTTLRVGGEARELVTVDTEADLVDAVREADARGDAVLVLGGGSNVVVADEGFDGRVVRVATRGVTTTRADDLVHVRAAAGEPWDALVARTVQDDLAGLECLSGIPGLVGATPIQNVGAYGQEVSDTITAVRAWDRRDACVVTLGPADCAFGYRDSAFKSAMPGRHVVLDVTFALRPDGAPAVRYGELSRALARLPSPTLTATRDAVLALRRAKSMVLDDDDPESRSAGSFFTNPVVDAAVADAIWASLLVTQGLRIGQKRRFEFAEVVRTGRSHHLDVHRGLYLQELMQA